MTLITSENKNWARKSGEADTKSLTAEPEPEPDAQAAHAGGEAVED